MGKLGQGGGHRVQERGREGYHSQERKEGYESMMIPYTCHTQGISLY